MTVMRRQTTWGWLALGNFFLGGSGAGLYVAAFALSLPLSSRSTSVLHSSTFVSVGLVILGLACVGLEAGKKTRAINVFFNLKTSWMSREALFASVFVLLGLIDIFLSNSFIEILTFVFALGLVVSQGYILLGARAIPAWRNPVTPLLMWSSSVASGTGFYLLISPFSSSFSTPAGLIWEAVSLVSSTLIIISTYYATAPSNSSDLKKAFRGERNRELYALSIALGSVVPLVISLLSGRPFELSVLVVGATGLLLVAGSAFMKYLILLRLSYFLPLIDLGPSSYVFRESK